EPTGECRDRGMGRAAQTTRHGADQGQRFLRCSRRGAQAVIVVSLTEPVLNLGGLGIAALLRSQCEQSMINDGASIIFHPTSAYHASHNLYYVKYTIWLRRRNNSLRRTYSVQLAFSPTPLFHQLANVPRQLPHALFAGVPGTHETCTADADEGVEHPSSATQGFQHHGWQFHEDAVGLYRKHQLDFRNIVD